MVLAALLAAWTVAFGIVWALCWAHGEREQRLKER